MMPAAAIKMRRIVCILPVSQETGRDNAEHGDEDDDGDRDKACAGKYERDCRRKSRCDDDNIENDAQHRFPRRFFNRVRYFIYDVCGKKTEDDCRVDGRERSCKAPQRKRNGTADKHAQYDKSYRFRCRGKCCKYVIKKTLCHSRLHKKDSRQLYVSQSGMSPLCSKSYTSAIAEVGHSPAQVPQLMHFSSSMMRALSASDIAPTGQSGSQVPQFTHCALLILYAIIVLLL